MTTKELLEIVQDNPSRIFKVEDADGDTYHIDDDNGFIAVEDEYSTVRSYTPKEFLIEFEDEDWELLD